MHEKTDDLAEKLAITTMDGEENGEYEYKRFLPIAFDGHCYYIRQHLIGEQDGDGVMDRKIGGISIIHGRADYADTVTVVGIGPNVGKVASKHHRKRYKWPKGMKRYEHNIKIGDTIILDSPHGEARNTLKRSPFHWNFELFIEESVPTGIVEI